MSQLLPEALVSRLEAATGAKIKEVVSRAGGGASRRGSEVTLQWPDGSEQTGYLSHDPRTADSARAEFFEREVAILQALSSQLADEGVRAPQFIVAVPDHLALMTALVEGNDRFERTADPQAVSRDFMAQLATLHRIETQGLHLPGFGQASRSPSRRIADRIRQLRKENLSAFPDPVIILALEWLEANLPSDDCPEVIVHGDAGPGNFLDDGSKVTALLDWELSHFGDPMEDLAFIWIRSMFQPFRPIRELFEAYENAGGWPVDIERVRFHRLYSQVGFTSGSLVSLFGENDVETAMLGVSLMFNCVHMRVIVESLSELTGNSLQPPAIPDLEPGYADRSYAIILDDLRNEIVPNIDDQQAATKAKSVARLVKWWRMRDRYAAQFERDECNEISNALGRGFSNARLARHAFVRAILNGKVSFETALQLNFNRVMRDTVLMADGLGKFRTTYFPSLEGSKPS